MPSVGLSSRNTRLISRFAELDEDGKSYTAALYLIAQLGKNFAVSKDSRISGAELMEYAMQKLQSARRFVGGKLVLVDREVDRPKLLKFYQQFNFKSWNVRHSKKDGIDYDQMICVLAPTATAGNGANGVLPEHHRKRCGIISGRCGEVTRKTKPMRLSGG